jgi:hypothetical protein
MSDQIEAVNDGNFEVGVLESKQRSWWISGCAPGVAPMAGEKSV